MTSPLTLIVDADGRKMAKPLEEMSRAMQDGGLTWLKGCWAEMHYDMNSGDIPYSLLAAAALTRLRELGFINDIGLVAIKAEEAGKP